MGRDVLASKTLEIEKWLSLISGIGRGNSRTLLCVVDRNFRAGDNPARVIIPIAHHHSERRDFQVGETVIYQPVSVLDPFSTSKVRNRLSNVRSTQGQDFDERRSVCESSER
jgi:hypothetical protein